MVETGTSSRDGTGAGDHDQPFVFGQHGLQLGPWDRMRLLILRGYIKDHVGAIEGDSDWVKPTATGLLVPLTAYWLDDATS